MYTIRVGRFVVSLVPIDATRRTGVFYISVEVGLPPSKNQRHFGLLERIPVFLHSRGFEVILRSHSKNISIMIERPLIEV